MDFKQTLRSDTTLSTIQRILQERHGTMHNLKLYKHEYTESNETVVSTKETATLKEVFDDDKGKPSSEEAPEYELWYDYQPGRVGSKRDPILLAWCFSWCKQGRQ